MLTDMPFTRADTAIQSPEAPKSNGNYSHVIKHGNVLHLSGWMGQDQDGKVVEGGAVAQTVSSKKIYTARNIVICKPYSVAT